ncbi:MULTISPECIES: hypothetical protein [Streptomyces]|uniref:hypothetical protein n=1 Tax=Streptomyces TaxID=1883 RepID=UPI0004C8028F|nr:hypothetical protein [Streptomyces sp. NRRL S-237]
MKNTGRDLGLGHEEHPLLGHRVRDIASGTEGEPMAVVREEVATHTGPRWTRRAYIRPEAGGRELPTALGNIEPLEAP